ncbi:uncharacterized protein LOC141926884 [Strix aluco]|uniref:uncharacterized protein LOC141926884 n=1 Tax=Strix aluco TaxID=111821 RepID=UPI003DA4D79B
MSCYCRTHILHQENVYIASTLQAHLEDAMHNLHQGFGEGKTNPCERQTGRPPPPPTPRPGRGPFPARGARRRSAPVLTLRVAAERLLPPVLGNGGTRNSPLWPAARKWAPEKAPPPLREGKGGKGREGKERSREARPGEEERGRPAAAARQNKPAALAARGSAGGRGGGTPFLPAPLPPSPAPHTPALPRFALSGQAQRRPGCAGGEAGAGRPPAALPGRGGRPGLPAAHRGWQWHLALGILPCAVRGPVRLDTCARVRYCVCPVILFNEKLSIAGELTSPKAAVLELRVDFTFSLTTGTQHRQVSLPKLHLASRWDPPTPQSLDESRNYKQRLPTHLLSSDNVLN